MDPKALMRSLPPLGVPGEPESIQEAADRWHPPGEALREAWRSGQVLDRPKAHLTWRVLSMDRGRLFVPEVRDELGWTQDTTLHAHQVEWGLTVSDRQLDAYTRQPFWEPVKMDARGRLALPVHFRMHLGVSSGGRVVTATDAERSALLLVAGTTLEELVVW